jgi:hypothetical protein
MELIPFFTLKLRRFVALTANLENVRDLSFHPSLELRGEDASISAVFF